MSCAHCDLLGIQNMCSESSDDMDAQAQKIRGDSFTDSLSYRWLAASVPTVDDGGFVARDVSPRASDGNDTDNSEFQFLLSPSRWFMSPADLIIAGGMVIPLRFCYDNTDKGDGARTQSISSSSPPSAKRARSTHQSYLTPPPPYYHLKGPKGPSQKATPRKAPSLPRRMAWGCIRALAGACKGVLAWSCCTKNPGSNASKGRRSSSFTRGKGTNNDDRPSSSFVSYGRPYYLDAGQESAIHEAIEYCRRSSTCFPNTFAASH